MSDPELLLRGIDVSFPGADGTPLHVLDDLDLRVGPGEFVSIIGPSGSGKSTLLHVVGGLVRPSAGEVLLDGADVTGERGHMAYMPQQSSLLPWRDVLGNVLLPQELAGVRTRASEQEARGWLDRVGLGEFVHARPEMLSGGMRQRVSFLRALLAPQPLMCLDEPFSALDALTRAEMQRWLLQIWESERRSVLFITHTIEEALLLSDAVYVLSARPGRVVERVEVPFGRPRGDVEDSPEFVALRRRLTHLLRDDTTSLEIR